MFKKKPLLNNVFIENKSGNRYLIFTREDKTWIMPETKMMPALGMYQPTSVRGKIYKKIIYYGAKNSLMKSGLPVETVKLSVNKQIMKYINEHVGQEHFFIGGYMGDTSSKQNDKVTLQIYDDKKILGYVKITKEKDVVRQFEKEICAIKKLKGKGIENIPEVSDITKAGDLSLFFQSTEKKLSDQVKLSFGEKQIDFVNRIVQLTKTETVYEDTDFYKDVAFLKTKSDDFKENDGDVLRKAIHLIENTMEQKQYDFSFSHGDYTLWNVYYTGGHLYAFDFEYCSDTMPAYLDIFHYLTQLSLLGKQNGVGKTVHLYKKYRKKLEKYISDPDFIYLCYLVHIISFYLQRTEIWNETIAGYNEKRIGIMDYLIGKMENKWSANDETTIV